MQQAQVEDVLERTARTEWLRADSPTAPVARAVTTGDPYAHMVARVREAWAAGRGTWIASRDLEWLSHRLRLRTHEPDLTPRVWFGPGRVAPLERAMIRALELTVAAFVLLVCGPLWLLIAWLVKRDGGPALHASQRVGRNGTAFRLLKFRTMAGGDHERRDAARRRSRGAIIQGAFPEFVDRLGRRITKNPKDERVTRLGRLLRSTSLDEVPQFLHVLRGTMALVGPRPYVLDEVACFKPWHHLRHAGRPGITGLWQVSGRATVAFDESVMLDIYYLANRSFWIDLQIVLRTPLSMLLGRGAC